MTKTKPAKSKLDERTIRVLAAIDEAITNEGLGQGTMPDLVKAMLDQVDWGELDRAVIKNVLRILMANSREGTLIHGTGEHDNSFDEKRRDAIVAIADGEHRLYCRCCNARAQRAA